MQLTLSTYVGPPHVGALRVATAIREFIGAVAQVAGPATRTTHSMPFTFAPQTPPLAVMHAVGRLFPRGNRAPAIVPVAEAALRRRIAGHPGLANLTCGRTERISSGFRNSQAMELERR